MINCCLVGNDGSLIAFVDLLNLPKIPLHIAHAADVIFSIGNISDEHPLVDLVNPVSGLEVLQCLKLMGLLLLHPADGLLVALPACHPTVVLQLQGR